MLVRNAGILLVTGLKTLCFFHDAMMTESAMRPGLSSSRMFVSGNPIESFITGAVRESEYLPIPCCVNDRLSRACGRVGMSPSCLSDVI